MRPNSSRSYCVTRPEGKTSQLLPSISMVRVGILFQLHFLIDAIGIEDLLRRAGVGFRQGLRVGCLEKLEECAREPCLLEYPEATVGFRVVVSLFAQLLLKPLTIRRGDEGSLNGQRPGHIRVRFRGRSRVTSSRVP